MSTVTRKKNKRTNPLPLAQVAVLPDYPRAPLLALRRYRSFLKEQHGLIDQIPAFAPLSRSFSDLDRTLGAIESEFRRFVDKDISLQALNDYLEEEVPEALQEFTDGVRFRADEVGEGNFAAALEEITERLWGHAIASLPRLEDALKSACDQKDLLKSQWEIQFDQELAATAQE